MNSDKDYYVLDPNSFQARVSTRQRRVMYERFVSLLSLDSKTSILDVGVTSDRTFANSNYLEAWHPYPENITAVGLDDASFLQDQKPGIVFVKGNGLMLPFRNQSFDVVHCSAVIEHVGKLQNQTQLVAECARVARRGFLITTPYRWFPVEVHTSIPFIHWLPKAWHRAVISYLGYAFYGAEENLNLMDKRDFYRIGFGATRVAFGGSFGESFVPSK
jgi:ubiquinone/menaquinone biosynthesis C-methylase UbiE